MAWSAPMTAVVNAVFTAAQYNQYVRDNFLETTPAKATTAGSIFAVTATNTIAERFPSSATVATAQTTSSTTYTDLTTTGPAVTVTTGTRALVWVYASIQQTSAAQEAYMSYAVSGATTDAATDNRAAALKSVNANQAIRATCGIVHVGLTPGSNTFTAKYRATAANGSFVDRKITVIPL